MNTCISTHSNAKVMGFKDGTFSSHTNHIFPLSFPDAFFEKHMLGNSSIVFSSSGYRLYQIGKDTVVWNHEDKFCVLQR